MDAKSILSEILDFYKYKVDNNLCTPEEMETASKVLQENMDISGSIEDFAKFYGVSNINVRVVINRKLSSKPVRKVLYPFNRFVKIVPDSWRKKRTKQ